MSRRWLHIQRDQRIANAAIRDIPSSFIFIAVGSSTIFLEIVLSNEILVHTIRREVISSSFSKFKDQGPRPCLKWTNTRGRYGSKADVGLTYAWDSLLGYIFHLHWILLGS